MKEKHIAEINAVLKNLNESQLLYILTLLKKMFRGH